jgi:hypothetical protein
MKSVILRKAHLLLTVILIAGQLFIGYSWADGLRGAADKSMLAPSVASDDDINPERGDAVRGGMAKMWAQGFLSRAGVNFSHDKILKERIGAAFDDGRAINIFGHQAVSASDLDAETWGAAADFIRKALSLRRATRL